MSQGDLEPRVAALEAEMLGVKQEIRDFRRAAAGSFNALRADFADLRDHVDRRFEQVDRGFMEMRGRLDGVAAGQLQIVELIESIIGEKGR